MSSDRTTVSLRDFYSAMGIIWVFIMFMAHKVFIEKPNNPGWRDYVFVFAAMGMMLVFAGLSFSEMRRSRNAKARGFPIEPISSDDSAAG
jgi:hypothetical protein